MHAATATNTLAATVIRAASMAAEHTANDNAGAAWQSSDAAPCAHDYRHLVTHVLDLGARTRAVFVAITGEVEPRDWSIRVGRLDRRACIELAPRDEHSRASERRERVLRAILRAQGVEVC